MKGDLHQILVTNTDLAEFCMKTGIFEIINQLLNQNTELSKNLAKKLISDTEFPINYKNPKTLIIGNGDVINYDHGLQLAKQTNVDGIMIGRGIFKDPWAFLDTEQTKVFDTKENRILLLKKHILEWQETWQDTKHFPVLKKFVKMYINGFPNSAQLRSKFMEMETAEQMLNLCEAVLKS